MTYVYRTAYGPNWLETISSPEQRADWGKRYEQEKKKRTGKGVSVVPNLGLAYSDMQDLLGFVNKHWNPIEPAFGASAKSETKALLTRFETLRNTAMHSRNPLIFEEDLMSGIAGQIRNQVTIFMSTQDEHGDYFPRIESIVDGFGNSFVGDPQKVTANSLENYVKCREPLTPGQIVTFTCTGVDPQDRELEFIFSRNMFLFLRGKKTIGGQPVTLQWKVKNSDVGPSRTVVIGMKAVGAKYHRFGTMDQQVSFRYKVNPPISGR
jgi:hypothetical protein